MRERETGRERERERILTFDGNGLFSFFFSLQLGVTVVIEKSIIEQRSIVDRSNRDLGIVIGGKFSFD